MSNVSLRLFLEIFFMKELTVSLSLCRTLTVAEVNDYLAEVE